MKRHKILVLVGIIASSITAKAQLDPLSSQYYNNRYQLNPAFAGFEHGTNLNLGYRSLWNNIPGAPVTQAITVDHGFNKVGVGLNVVNDKAGLQRQTRVVGSFAYHLPLNENNKLNFGVSLGFANQRLSNSDIKGNPNDVLVGQYNDRESYIDGDFGVAYTSNRLTINAALPNLNKLFKRDDTKYADVARFYSAISYKIPFNTNLNGEFVEPLVAYRAVSGYDNIWDAGAQFALVNQQILLSAMYHSTKNATFGFGMDYKKKYLISGLYTTSTSQLNNYTNGGFEVFLRVKMGSGQ
ncbi:PorP/SprF family type IX secretion system membrane protein [Pedobacter sp. ASV12]|uniref:PorP/SprF family type IX secretion system membrane protein n=1 Tax=Pedobacter sp. ASV12 TaxID=2795120 RepID=UPI0018ED8D92|nr:PorP/SprF family type IX secretion system membrane protein [Pedobacter sp. ASV12]